jgi:GntR family transcriptional regulator, transcriptional repressor for pyruvate dehydrogenase complex
MTGKTNHTTERMSREWLAAELADQITSGRLAEGVMLPSERKLSQRYGMSRPVVREVLRGLVEQNLVEVIPGRGAYVRRAKTSDAARPMGILLMRRQVTPRELMEARKMLECEAAELAAAQAVPEDLRALEQALAGFDNAVDLIERARFDLAFHTSIVRAAHNPVIEIMFSSIVSMVAELMLRSLGDRNVSRAGLPFHKQIFEAIRERDPERARVAVAGHLSVAERLYGTDYDRSLTILARRELDRLFASEAVLDDLVAAAIPVERNPGRSEVGGDDGSQRREF